MDLKRTDAWESAEFAYSSIHAARMMPMPGMSLSGDEITERLADIVRACPKFYPAVLELGIRRLAGGAGAAEEKRILKGVRLMLEVGDPEDLDEEVGSLIDNLENIWRYDIAQRCLELLVERHPQNALFRDYLAHDKAKLGDVNAALELASQAVAMAPGNSFFRSNLGLYHLMAGNADEARTHLTAAHQLDPDNEVTQGNLVILDYIAEHGGSLSDYLLRPVDQVEFARLADNEDFEELDRVCNSYNRDRLAAFGQSLARDQQRRSRCADTMSTLTIFFAFVDRVANMVGHLNEQLFFVHEHFNAIMHKFIFKFGDVDQPMIEDICEFLLDFYAFLERAELVPDDELEEFQERVRVSKPVLIERMNRYNEIRHDEDMNEEEKEAIREELFGGDHAWPHL